MKVFIINLEKSVERKEKIEKLAIQSGLDYEFIPAFDGRNLTVTERNELYDEGAAKRTTGRIFSNGEIGCAISHRKAYELILERNIDRAVIVEDDVLFENDCKKVLEGIEKIKKRNFIIKLEDRAVILGTSVWASRIDPGYTYSRCIEPEFYGAYGYCIDNLAARNLLGFPKRISYLSDDWNAFSRKVSVYILKPHVIRLNEEYHSDIWQFESADPYVESMRDRKNLLKKFKNKIARPILKLVYKYLCT